MKLPITPEQGELLRECSRGREVLQELISMTLNDLNEKLGAIISLEDATWQEIITTHDLDTTNHHWRTIVEDSNFFVVSSPANPPAKG